MRLLTMLLMLCLLQLSTADAQLKCNPSLIKGVPPAEFQFDSATKRLTCIGKENSLMAIHIQDTNGLNPMPYQSLKCDDSGGWKPQIPGGTQSAIHYNETSVVDASSVLNIACVEYCASSGASVEINADTPNGPFIEVKFPKDNKDICHVYHAWRIIQKPFYCSPYLSPFVPSGWNHGNDKITEEIRMPLQFETKCNNDPPPACTVKLMITDRRFRHTNEHNYRDLNVDLPSRTLTCRFPPEITSENSIMAIRVLDSSKRYLSMKCDEVGGWKSKQSRLEKWEWISEEENVAEATSPLEVECVNQCKATGDGIIYNTDDLNAAIQCPNGFKLHFWGKGIRDARCYENGKWTLITDGSEVIEIGGEKATEFECRPTKCYMPKKDRANFDSGTKTLTCYSENGASMAILINSARYTSAVCDEHGQWHGIVGTRERVKLPWSFNLNFACIKYCTALVDNNQINRVMSSPLISSVRCKRENFRIFPEGMTIGFKNIDCDLQSGWQFNNQNISTKTADPLQLECKEACTQNNRSIHVQYSSQSLNGIVETNFKCISNGDKAKIRVNGEIVNPPLKCHIDRGYTDASKTTYAGAFDAVKLDCATGTTTTTTTTQSSKTEEPQAQSSVAVVAGSIGGVLLIIAIVVVIFVIIVLKKKRPENSENGMDKSKGRKGKHRKGNDKSGADQPSSGL